MKKIIIMCLTFWLGSIMPGYSQHNPIFGGAANDGSDSERAEIRTNNGLYTGGVNDGYSAERDATQTNGEVFTGGINDGYGLERHKSQTNGDIFTGGINDGYAVEKTASQSNNGIFTGGINDGYSVLRAKQQTNNGIFTGGINDGYAIKRSSEIVTPDPNLPIELLYFDAFIVADDVQIQWETATEIDNNYFTVERAKDPSKPDDLFVVPSQGNGQFNHFYEVLDDDPFPGISYYRLRQTDFDGTESYSDWVSVKFEREEVQSDLQIMPNPVSGNYFDVHVSGFESGENLQFQFVDMKGRVLNSFDALADISGSIEQRISVSAFLPGGTYVVVIVGENEVQSGKVVVVR